MKNNHYRLWLIVFICVLNAIGLTIVFPLFPFLLAKYLPASQVVFGLSALVSVYAVCQFFAAPVFGAMSDHFGRRPILIISLLGSVVGYLLLGIGGALWLFLLGRIIDGLTAGDMSALIGYITDSTDKEARTTWFGYIGGAMGFGTMIGPALGGFLGTISLALPFYVTGALIFLSAVLVYFFLPESLAVGNRSPAFSLRHLNTFAHFKDVFILKEARLFLIIGLFFYAGLNIYQFNATLFLKDTFAWGPAAIGKLLMLVGLCDIISRSIVLPPLLKKFTEHRLAAAGLYGLACGFSLMFISALTHSVILFIIAVAGVTLGEGLFDPAYNGLLSATVDENHQGQLQGANQSLQSAYHALIPILAAAIYFYSHSAIYALAAISLIVALIIFTSHNSKIEIKKSL